MYDNSIISYIEKLRDKPDHIKSQIAFGFSGVITFFIFMFWLSSFFQVSPSSKDLAISQSQNTSGADSQIVSFNGSFASVVKGVKELKDTILLGFGKMSYEADDAIIVTDGEKTIPDTIKINEMKK